MSFDTEGGKEIVKVEGRVLWIEDLRAEERGVILYCITPPSITVLEDRYKGLP